MDKSLSMISEGGYSTLTGRFGGCPESPDGRLLVYTRKYSLENDATEIWLCGTDLTGHRKLYDARSGNHNSVQATFVDNDRIVFVDCAGGVSLICVLNVRTGAVEQKIAGRAGHRARRGKFPFCLGGAGAAVYWFDCYTGETEKLFDTASLADAMVRAGFPNDPGLRTRTFSHLQLNPSADKIMMRIGDVLGCRDLKTDEYFFIPNKPIHQLWYDDDSYMAMAQPHDGDRFFMEASRMNRYAVTGEIIEALGGIGNHMDGSPDRRYFVADTMFLGEVIRINLYKKGIIEPLAELDAHRFDKTAWEHKVHSNPTFSADGKRVYFNRPVSDDKTVAVFADISAYIQREDGS